MKNKKRIKVIVIVGATASGKSDLAIEIAGIFNGEIVSVDSRQVYRGLDLGTGKVTKKDQRKAPHHMLDIVRPGRRYSIAQFKKKANTIIHEIAKRGHTPILVGGSHLYVRALVHGYSIPAAKPDLPYRKRLEKKTTAQLLAQLLMNDAAYYSSVDKKNRRRIIRALEVYHVTGKPFSSLAHVSQPTYDSFMLGIDVPREILYSRIDDRVDERLKKGMIKEVERLLENRVSVPWLKNLGLEYRFITEYLQGAHTQKNKSEMLQRLKYATHDFARRQLVWYRREADIHWISNTHEALKQVSAFLSDDAF